MLLKGCPSHFVRLFMNNWKPTPDIEGNFFKEGNWISWKYMKTELNRTAGKKTLPEAQRTICHFFYTGKISENKIYTEKRVHKRCQLSNYYTEKYQFCVHSGKIYTGQKNYLHRHRRWCRWQISGMFARVLSLLLKSFLRQKSIWYHLTWKRRISDFNILNQSHCKCITDIKHCKNCECCPLSLLIVA